MLTKTRLEFIYSYISYQLLKQNKIFMKKIVLIVASILPITQYFGQATSLVQLDVEPKIKVTVSKDVPSIEFTAPNREALRAEDALRDRQGQFYRIGVAHFTNLTTENSGRWTTLTNGIKVWQLILRSKDAEALSFTFNKFALSSGAQFWMENKNLAYSTAMYNQSCVLEDGQFGVDNVWGDDIVLNLLQPQNEKQSEIAIYRVFHDYRSTGTPYPQLKYNNFLGSEVCEVNANCSPVGDTWTDENRGVAMINVKEGANQGYCTGSLINNLANDCKPYFLTANHCGLASSAADFALWRFYFRFEAAACTNPTTVGSGAASILAKNILGCLKISSTVDGGNTSSDFLLVKLGSATNEATVSASLRSASFSAYWNGWDAAATATAGGAGIHHPAGDIKKISTYTGTPVQAGWNNVSYTSHWRFSWSSNPNGWGVTEGGSSGSPMFNSTGKIVGTLTGGGSYCTAQSSQDYYGKFSWHWSNAQNGSTNARKLQPWLDPLNTGVTSQAGSYNPCNAANLSESIFNSILIYPNPASTEFTVDLTGETGLFTLELIDLSGKILSYQTAEGNTLSKVNVDKFANGIYNLRITSNEGIAVKQVVIK